MSKIVIHIPSKKEWHYIGANEDNQERMVAETKRIYASMDELYGNALRMDIPTFSDEDRLRVASLSQSWNTVQECQRDNELFLRTDNGTEMYLIGVEIDVTQKNKIVPTQLINRAGSVKERIQREDYIVKVHGNIIGEQGKFHHEGLKSLVSILNSASSIQCSAAYLNIFDITKLVFKTANFNQKGQKYFNVLPIELSFDSDEDYGFLVDE